MTNLEYIKTLSAEELADLLYDYWLPRGQYVWSSSKKGLVIVLGEEYHEEVIPTVRKNRTVEPQTYITEDRDTQILDAWQVHHRNITTVEDEPQTENPCGDCQEFDCYGCKHKQTERIEE